MRASLVPAVYHCGAGYIAYEEDFLGAMVRWVENGEAPDGVIATAPAGEGKVRTRPVYAYPARAQYRGYGSIDEVQSFQRALPANPTRDAYVWAGTR
jgi:feruloyl esterase